ncbi:MAG: hypothetical protein K6E29_08190 [Cyanobacteria bacterium RUI128]|nr:hypothetical protein [Cyanobacteria bacterium RUI128]
MKFIITFIQKALMINTDEDNKVGLSQFRDKSDDFSVNRVSFRNKDVKLSDLLRRA